MKEKRRYWCCVGLITAVLLLSAYINPINHYLSALLLVICAVVSYFYMTIFSVGKNWLDIRPVFSAAWVGTIGLAALRLTEYQEQWQSKTWICFAISFLAFHLGAEFGTKAGKQISQWIQKVEGKRVGRLLFSFKQERLYGICVIVSIFGFLCFAANVAIKGYIPFFASEANAYLNFYTKFYLFAVAASMISGLCYYVLKTQKLSILRQIVLFLCIMYSTFLFPILAVSRGNFITSALSLTTAIFYLNKRRFWVLVSCVIVMVSIYMLGSIARGYSTAQLNVFFEPAEIVLSKPINKETEATAPVETQSVETETTVPVGSLPQESELSQNQFSFRLPAKVAFLYSYLTVSHDNFNEAVENTKSFTKGVRQLSPFNVILRSRYIEDAIHNGEHYLVREHLNTTNLIGDAYYDFGAFGVGLFMFIWAFAFGAIQSCYFTGKGPFALLTLGNVMTPVALCFFATWMSVFSQWMHWGTILILMIFACVTITPKNKN